MRAEQLLHTRETVLLDGAMGTMLQAAGLPLGAKPEALNLEDPALIESIHAQYAAAGSRILCANTFGASAHKLAGTGYTVGQVVVLLLTQVVAWVFSLVFARLSRRYPTVTLLLVCIAGYFCVCLYALTLQSLIQFGIMAFGVGMFQGSIQSLSRSYFSKIIPPENSGEYFGLYDIFSKGASFLGSAVIAWVKFAGGTINIAVGLMALFFLGGFILLKVADRTRC